MAIQLGSRVTFHGTTDEVPVVGTVDGFQMEKGGTVVLVWVPDPPSVPSTKENDRA